MEKADVMMSDSFSFENCLLTYCFVCEKERVILRGEEFLDGERIYSKEFSLPLEDEMKVRAFYEILLESRTYPRMMEELAEEFFFWDSKL